MGLCRPAVPGSPALRPQSVMIPQAAWAAISRRWAVPGLSLSARPTECLDGRWTAVAAPGRQGQTAPGILPSSSPGSLRGTATQRVPVRLAPKEGWAPGSSRFSPGRALAARVLKKACPYMPTLCQPQVCGSLQERESLGATRAQ